MKRILFFCLTAIWAAGCASAPRPKTDSDLRRRSEDLVRRAQKPLKPEGVKEQTAKNVQEVAPEKAGKSDLANATYQKGKAVPFEEEGVWIMSKAESQLEAEKRAEEEAVGKALRKAGVDSYYGFSDVLAQQDGKTTQAVARYLGTWSRGVVRVDHISKPVFTPTKDGAMECRLIIRGAVVFNGEPDPGFELQANLSRSLIKTGEEISFTAQTNRDAFLYVLSVDESQKVYLVLPNKLAPETKVAQSVVFEFPPDGSGLVLTAILPEGKSTATEILHVIATKKEPLFNLEDLKEEDVGPYKILSPGTLGQVMAKLTKLPRSEWTMTVLPYQISR